MPYIEREKVDEKTREKLEVLLEKSHCNVNFLIVERGSANADRAFPYCSPKSISCIAFFSYVTDILL